jgi:hypothetical protein
MEIPFGNHVLEIDAEATRVYYQMHPELSSQDQAHRNFARWLTTLTCGEQALFHFLGIDDHSQCAMMECYVVNDDGLVHVVVTYTVAGKVIKEPESLRSVADLLPEAGVGEIELCLANEGSLVTENLPTDRFPDGQLFLCMLKKIPWMLDEQCQLPTRKQFFEAREARWEAEMIDDLRNLLKATHQPYEAIDPMEAEQLKVRCIENYVEPASLSKARDVCYTSEHSGRGFLWHIFSYGLTCSTEGDAARDQYEHLRATDYYVYLEEFGQCYRVMGDSLPNLDAIEELPDTYVISGSLDWIYAHTHEDGWFGPYLSARD